MEFAQPCGQFLLAAIQNSVEQGVELLRMVVMHRVAEFMEHDEVDERIGQNHKIQRQSYVGTGRAASPLAAHGFYTQTSVFESVFIRERF